MSALTFQRPQLCHALHLPVSTAATAAATRISGHALSAEDERLWHTEHEGDHPGEADLAVGVGGLPDPMDHGVADGLVAIHSSHHEDVGAAIE